MKRDDYFWAVYEHFWIWAIETVEEIGSNQYQGPIPMFRLSKSVKRAVVVF